METIVTFDLSTTCCGIAAAQLDKGKLVSIFLSNITPLWRPEDAGFKKASFMYQDKKYSTYVKKDESISTITARKKRMSELKKLSSEYRQKFIATGILETLRDTRPELVLMEANMAFRSMDTTKQLGEVSGILTGLCVRFEVPLEKVNVAEARKKWKVAERFKEFASRRTPEQMRRMNDPVKEILKEGVWMKYGPFLNKNYEDIVLDESDALVILDHHLEKRKVGV